MRDFDFLKKHCGEGYALVVDRISKFRKEGEYPQDVNELNEFSALTEIERKTLSQRGNIEKKLNTLAKDSQLILIRTHDKKNDNYLSDDNQIIFTYFRDSLGEVQNFSNENAGLNLICSDLSLDEKGSHFRYIGTNVRILYIRPQGEPFPDFKIIPGTRSGVNTGTLIKPFSRLEDVFIGGNEIVSHCEEQGLDRKSLQIIKGLASEPLDKYLRENCVCSNMSNIYRKIGM